MRMRSGIIILLFHVFSCTISAQTATKNWFEENPRQAIDSMSMVVRYHSSFPDQQEEYRALMDSMLAEIKSSRLDSAWTSLAYKEAYKVISKGDKQTYFGRVKSIASYAPKDSVHLKFFSNYLLGNYFVFSSEFDSAAYYFNRALDFDEGYDLGMYEGAVAERLSLIFYQLSDYNRSLEFAKLSLLNARGKLKAAVYNQMANTYALLGRYEEAATAYDSAAFNYEKIGSQRWWTPIYNSLTAHLELKDSVSFNAAYKRIKDVSYIKGSEQFDQIINLTKSEFSLTEWQRSNIDENAQYGGMVLPRTKENEQFVRSVINDQINASKGEWRKQRDALYLLKRWYSLCQPDSVFYAYEQILALDRNFVDEGGVYQSRYELDTENVAELQELTARLSYKMLKKRLDEISDLKKILIAESQNLTLISVIILIVGIGVFISRRLLKENALINDQLSEINHRQESLLKQLLADHQFEAWRDASSEPAFEEYADCVVICGEIRGFSSAVLHLSPDNLIQALEDYFTGIKSIANEHRMKLVRRDGSSFIITGGINGALISPREALSAASEIYERTQTASKNWSNDTTVINLGMSVHLGKVQAGSPGNDPVNFDYWGEVFEQAQVLQYHAKQGEVIYSKKAFYSEVVGEVWPHFTLREIHGEQAIVFQI